MYVSGPELENPALTAGAALEDFEEGTKTSYLRALVTLSSGDWWLSDALIGASENDHKYGKKALRLINTGSAQMNFDLATGASEVHITHAVYGADGESKWSLWVSKDQGSTFTQVGEAVTTSSATLTETVFTVDKAGAIRFEIRRESGSSRGLNIDDVEVVAYTGDDGGEEPGTTEPDDSNYLFGNPSGATKNITDENNYLMDKTYYILSYNRSRAIPNWVSWHVDKFSTGSSGRTDDFAADTSLPSGWYQVQPDSYSGSGFDRGHNCPSGDRTSTVPANQTTFLMTNMIPQAPNNNQKAWANLENYVRDQVSKGNEAYVIMGNYGKGGTGSGSYAETVDGGRVTVPNRVWKVVVILTDGSNDISRVTGSTRVIAVDTPNENTVGTDWGIYRTTVDAIEAATGYDVLSALPNDVEAVVEAKVDTGSTN